VRTVSAIVFAEAARAPTAKTIAETIAPLTVLSRERAVPSLDLTRVSFERARTSFADARLSFADARALLADAALSFADTRA
jgi:hypothetical protein